MKKIFISLLLLASAFMQGHGAANDINGIIARFPAPTQVEFNAALSSLAETGKDGFMQLAGMLQPAAEGQNSTVEYALAGLTAYLSAPGREDACATFREALKEAIPACTDNPNRAFMMTLLQRCGTAADAPFMAQYVADPYLRQWALDALIAIPGTEDTFMKVMKSGDAPHDELAYAAGRKGLSAAEPIILKWLGEADGADRRPFYKALGEIGGTRSLSALAKAAKADNYGWEADGATESYIALINRLYSTGARKKAVAAAKSLLKSTENSNVLAAATELLLNDGGKQALPLLLTQLRGADRQVRAHSLRCATPWADEEVYSAVAALTADANLTTDARIDIVNYLGTNHVTSQTGAITPLFASTDNALAEAAMRAAGKIGGEDALTALVNELGGPRSAIATEVLLAFNGNVGAAVAGALQAEAPACTAALSILSTRHFTAAAPQILALTGSTDPAIRTAAIEALPGVATQNEFPQICALLESGATPAAPVVDALLSSVRTLSPDSQYAKVAPFIASSRAPWLYYPLLAQAGTPEAISRLIDGYTAADSQEGSQAALSALTKVQSTDMIDILYDIALRDNRHDLLPRYAQLVGTSGFAPERKFELYSNGLQATSDPGICNILLGGLASVHICDALMLADSYQANPATARAAAAAVREIASKNISADTPPSFTTPHVRAALETARDIYRAGGTADDGYAVDDITSLLAKLP